ncbi:serine--tRNA ligase [Candidatus Uhrbacteria bacterium RIFCSPLOWO2_02_FULL_51_9]|uniref:Serine--tRNA ligase n=1 Tax=Candidatus Uhrbacteria bacterium RIFCSPLOWO2_02_FULL_51_9 TaxID=1802410 RepID=A0A1F7VCX3_9BACT|nr:MAG: serine--tRNA ligase [Candidatus Uhrbacteria bacterium RIFCSPLOWO2_02_FULL_51_9]
MLDSSLIREHPELIQKALRDRAFDFDLRALLTLDEERRALLQHLEGLRADRNSRSKEKPSKAEITRLKKLSETIKQTEEKLATLLSSYHDALLRIPNIPDKSVPIGKDETNNKVLKKWGKKPALKKPLEYLDLPAIQPYLELDRGARTSGARFYYLRGPLALLEHALMRYAVDFITAKGFELLVTPILVQESALLGTGYFPNGKQEVYAVNPGQDNLYLIGTSEQAITAFHQQELLEADDLPRRYTACTPCFRREAGSYGKDTRGILRVHQFNKVEMVVFSKPDDSWKILQEMIAISEEFYQSLGIPYQLVALCAGDLGFQSAKTIDIEGWFPGQARYRELGSASNTTDFQARRLNIRFKNTRGEKSFVHTLNNTVVADRALLAILENYQQKDGSVTVPTVLQKYTRFKKVG